MLSTFKIFFFFFSYFFIFCCSSLLFFTLSKLLQQLIMVIIFPCKIYNRHAVQCHKCHILVHIKCNKINLQTYTFLQKSPTTLYCIKCSEDIFRFGTISNEELFKTNQGSKIKFTVLTKTTLHLARILSINSMRLWMTLHLQQFPASIVNPVSFHF